MLISVAEYSPLTQSSPESDDMIAALNEKANILQVAIALLGMGLTVVLIALATFIACACRGQARHREYLYDIPQLRSSDKDFGSAANHASGSYDSWMDSSNQSYLFTEAGLLRSSSDSLSSVPSIHRTV